MNKVTDTLYYGDLIAGHTKGWDKFAIVHACKDPCHKNCVGYTNNLPNTHPHYLSSERDNHLYLNMVDPPVPLFKIESFHIFFEFMDRQIKQRPVFIHCNQGLSRAPSLTLLYMAKRLKLLPNENYKIARMAFEQKYPYQPGKGIERFLTDYWDVLGDVSGT